MFSMLVKRSAYDDGFSERLLKRPFAVKWYDSRFGMREPWVLSVLEMPSDNFQERAENSSPVSASFH